MSGIIVEDNNWGDDFEEDDPSRQDEIEKLDQLVTEYQEDPSNSKVSHSFKLYKKLLEKF